MTADEASGVATTLERPERTIFVRGISTHLFEAGAPSAPPLLYLHGTNLGNLWLDFHRTWRSSSTYSRPILPASACLCVPTGCAT